MTGRPADLLLDSVTCSEIGLGRDRVALRDHDWMEQITLGGTAATIVYVVVRLLSPCRFCRRCAISNKCVCRVNTGGSF